MQVGKRTILTHLVVARDSWLSAWLLLLSLVIEEGGNLGVVHLAVLHVACSTQTGQWLKWLMAF